MSTQSRSLSERQGVRRNLTLFAWARLDLLVLSFTISSVVAYWGSRGLSLFDGLLLQALFAIAVALVEVPSGYLADLYGRRLAMLVGGFFRIVGISFYFLGWGFWTFLVAEILLAIGFAWESGTDEALLQDSLIELGEGGTFAKHWSRALFVQGVFGGGTCIIGGHLAEINLQLPYLASLLTSVVLQVVRFQITEPQRHIAVSRRAHLRQILDVSRDCIVNNQTIRWVLITSGLTHAVLQSGFWLYQPLLAEAGVNPVWNGWIFAGFQVANAMAAGSAATLMVRRGERTVLWLMFASLALGFLGVGWSSTVFGLLFIAGHQFCRGSSRVLFSTVMNREVSSTYRATALSVKNLVTTGLYSLVIVTVGSLHAHFGTHVIWVSLGWVTVAMAVVFHRGGDLRS